MESFKTADDFYQKQQRWHNELLVLRKLIRATVLKEELKWGGPVYTHKGKNILGLAGFKSYFGIWFYQGIFLQDPHNLLINAQSGTTKALRQMRFTSLQQTELDIIRAYILEAIENQEKGLQVKPDKTQPIIVPSELKDLFNSNPTLKDHFDRLNKTKQREYTTYIASAKQEKTKRHRLEKVIPMINQEIGLHDKYRH